MPRWFLQEKVAGASMICCISYFARSQLMRISQPSDWSKLVVAPLGVDPAVFTLGNPRQMREQTEILCVGQIVPSKGQHVLLEAVPKLVLAGHNLRLRIIVGDGQDRGSLEEAARAGGIGERVSFEGAVNQDQILKFYRSVDIFVLASFAEGVPVLPIEAMAMELPCVSTHVAGIPELVRSDIEGILVMLSDREALRNRPRAPYSRSEPASAARRGRPPAGYGEV